LYGLQHKVYNKSFVKIMVGRRKTEKFITEKGMSNGQIKS